ncbi:hypothetical protein [Bacillus sp. B-jedd]|uniref:hypothetical protein n=1 Tax=Bacillus sp. B-jedd TaxID=1476857 RepID=UPI00051561B5|nr:hypothetical protein [Bacillus sp. B-jedd]CEG26234.1 hypothetical protein BN1002_01076 [Bacillus sp. B-jedd]
MDKRILHVWQPVTCLEKANVIFAKLTYGNSNETNGLRLELTDGAGNAVEIVYDQWSVTMVDYIWTFRHVNEIKRCDLNRLIDRADFSVLNDSTAQHFYKMENSDFLEWYDQLPWLGSGDVPHVEHHIYMYNDGVFEVIADYEPKFIVKKAGS